MRFCRTVRMSLKFLSYKGGDIEVVDSVVEELESIQWHLDKMNPQTRKYKRLSINDGVIVYQTDNSELVRKDKFITIKQL